MGTRFQPRPSVSGWKNPPWWPTANLRVCTRDACGEFISDEADPDVCLRCGIVHSEHVPVWDSAGEAT